MPAVRIAAVAAVAAVASALVLAVPARAAPGDTELVSVTASGTRAAGDSNLRHGGGALSADGRYVVFHSFRPTLVPGDDNGVADVFLRDRASGATRLVSESLRGGVANAYSADASISADGRVVAFFSPASDLVQGDRNGVGDIFVWHRESGRLEIASVGSGGGQGDDTSLESALSADGRFVAFTSFAANFARRDTNGSADVFLRDLHAGYTERVSVGVDGRPSNGYSWQPSVSADGRYVAFYSTASNLVPDDRGGRSDVFVRDRQTRQTLRASVAADGTAANGYSVQPTLSGNGRYVAFVSAASNLVPGDTNRLIDVFVKDLETGHLERVSVGSDGRQANGASYEPTLSADGRYVAFESFASNLVAGDTNRHQDAFVHDRQTGETHRVSVHSDGSQAAESSWTPSLSADGRFVAFRSDAADLSALDDNRSSDVYLHDLGPDGGPGVAFTLKPSRLDFGTRTAGSSSVRDFWLRNKAGSYLAIDRIFVRGEDAAQFAVEHRCGTLVAPDDVCRIRVRYTPTGAGAVSAELKVHAADGVVRTRALTGLVVP